MTAFNPGDRVMAVAKSCNYCAGMLGTYRGPILGGNHWIVWDGVPKCCSEGCSVPDKNFELVSPALTFPPYAPDSGTVYYNMGITAAQSTAQLTSPPAPKKGTTIMSSIKEKVRLLTLSKEDRVLQEQGFYDTLGNITIEGREQLNLLVEADYWAKLVELADKMDAADKAKAKK